MRKQVITFFTLSTILFLTSCSSNDDDNSCNDLVSNGEEISTNLITAALDYFANPTNITCLEYENAVEGYIDYSNSILDCLDSDDRAELEEEIQDLETELAGLNCT